MISGLGLGTSGLGLDPVGLVNIPARHYKLCYFVVSKESTDTSKLLKLLT